MKKILITIFVITMLVFAACRKLDVKVESQYTFDNFPTTPASYAAAMGPVYTNLAYSTSGFSYAVEYWRMQEFSTDEAIIPARDGNYDDGAQYRQLHLHSWSPDHTNVISNWQWGFGGINTANRLVTLFNAAPETPTKIPAIAEAKLMRSLYYFMMMDLYGNVPIIDTFPTSSLQPATMPRAQVFTFIENTVKSVLPSLSRIKDGTTYGRATKWMAFALLEKMYLNAEYYTGTPRYNDAVVMADSILANGSFSLDASYNSIFAPDNGPAIAETIFAVPYDANLINGNHFSRFGLVVELKDKYVLPFRPSVAMSTIPDFYAYFNLPNDVRNNTWVNGKQYNFDGSPIMVATTKKALDATYTGADANNAISYQLEITGNLTLTKPATMDVGNDLFGMWKGTRSIKYYPDKNANPSTRYQNNDVPMFRLADVIMMKAEAILRGATATTVKGELQTPVVLFNKIRSRAGAATVTTIDLQGLLDERAREFAWEGWRRNDLIRFGQFERDWGFKTSTVTTVNPVVSNQTYRRIYPVPKNEIVLNPKLVQNPGY